MDKNELIQAVIRALREQGFDRKRILVLPGENSPLSEQWLLRLGWLKEKGYQLEVAGEPLGQRGQELAPLFDKATAGVAGVDGILACQLDFSSVVRISTGLEQSMTESCIMAGLAAGKPVFTPVEAMLPLGLTEQASSGYLGMVVGHLRRLVSYGCQVGRGEALVQKLHTFFNSRPEAGEQVVLQKGIITLEDVLQAYGRGNCRLEIGSSSKMTDQAAAFAAKNGIKVLKRLV